MTSARLVKPSVGAAVRYFEQRYAWNLAAGKFTLLAAPGRHLGSPEPGGPRRDHKASAARKRHLAPVPRTA
jgi:hypothetical protein